MYIYTSTLTPTEAENETPIRQLRKFWWAPKVSELSVEFRYRRGRESLKIFRKLEKV